VPDWCLSMLCIDCESHAVVGGKLDCNYMNRLGLSQPTVKTFLESAPTEETIDSQVTDLEKQLKAMEEKKKELEELKEKYGDKSGG